MNFLVTGLWWTDYSRAKH